MKVIKVTQICGFVGMGVIMAGLNGEGTTLEVKEKCIRVFKEDKM